MSNEIAFQGTVSDSKPILLFSTRANINLRGYPRAIPPLLRRFERPCSNDSSRGGRTPTWLRDEPERLQEGTPVFYAAVAEAKRTPVIVIDDAQDASTEALLILEAMPDFEADASHRITFILAGQPELATILQYSHSTRCVPAFASLTPSCR